jgi:hypothetical protein
MLFDQKKFDIVESFLAQNGTLVKFERESGEIKGRMMIDLIDPPDELNIQIPKGSYYFGASFDFYDSSIGLVFDPKRKTAGSGLWVTSQKDGAEPPQQEWIQFFVKTLVDNISPDGSFSIPMYTFISDYADLTVVPTNA